MPSESLPLFKCRHIEPEKMNDEELDALPRFTGITQTDLLVKLICCETCAENLQKEFNTSL